MSASQPVIKCLDHLGRLIDGFCHEIGLPTIIDRVIPKYSEHNISHDDAVLAMVLNGLDFHSLTLHMFSDFCETKPVSKLLAKDIEAITQRMMSLDGLSMHNLRLTCPLCIKLLLSMKWIN